MDVKKVSDFAHKHGVSNNVAKRMLRSKRYRDGASSLPVRGAPVAGIHKLKKRKG